MRDERDKGREMKETREERVSPFCKCVKHTPGSDVETIPALCYRKGAVCIGRSFPGTKNSSRSSTTSTMMI